MGLGSSLWAWDDDPRFIDPIATALWPLQGSPNPLEGL